MWCHYLLIFEKENVYYFITMKGFLYLKYALYKILFLIYLLEKRVNYQIGEAQSNLDNKIGLTLQIWRCFANCAEQPWFLQMLGKAADSADDGENKFWKSAKCMECYIVGAHTVGGLLKAAATIFKACIRVPHFYRSRVFYCSWVYAIRNWAYNVGLLIYHLLKNSMKALLHECTGRNKSHPLF